MCKDDILSILRRSIDGENVFDQLLQFPNNSRSVERAVRVMNEAQAEGKSMTTRIAWCRNAYEQRKKLQEDSDDDNSD